MTKRKSNFKKVNSAKEHTTGACSMEISYNVLTITCYSVYCTHFSVHPLVMVWLVCSCSHQQCKPETPKMTHKKTLLPLLLTIYSTTVTV